MKISVDYYFAREKWSEPEEFAKGLEERHQRVGEFLRNACFTNKSYCKGATSLLDEDGTIIAHVKIGI